jgi:predicted secreted protein
MSAKSGRKLKLYKNGQLIAAVKSKSIKINNEPVDITNDDDAGFRSLLDDAVGGSSMEIAVEGVMKTGSSNADLFAAALSADAAQLSMTVDVSIDGLSDLTGSFFMSAFELKGETGDAITFSATLMSNGAWNDSTTT